MKKIVNDLLIILVCILCLQTCLDETPEEFEINDFNAILLEGKIAKELFYTGLAGNHFDRTKYIPTVIYKIFKEYSLKYRKCRGDECDVCIGVPPGVMLRNPPHTIILIQTNDSSFFLYHQCNVINFDSIIFNPSDKNTVFYKRSGKYYIEPKVYSDILKALRKEGVKKDFMEVVQYSKEELKSYVHLFAFSMFAAIFLILGILNGFVMSKKFDEEEKERYKRY